MLLESDSRGLCEDTAHYTEEIRGKISALGGRAYYPIYLLGSWQSGKNLIPDFIRRY